MRKPQMAIPLLTVLALLVGCGESTDETTVQVQTLSKSQLIKRADAVCAKFDKEKTARTLQFAKENPQATKSQAGLDEAVLTIVVPLLEEELGGLQEIAPNSDAASYQAVLDALAAEIEQFEADPSTFKGKGLFDTPNRLAQEYGFRTCSDFL